MHISPEDRFNIELLKLLAQVAWGDGQLDHREVEAIYGLGRSWLVPEPELQALLVALRQGTGLPPPNLGLLRKRPTSVREAVHALAVVDQTLAPDEIRILAEIQALLKAG